jgi:hypothetical protein
LRAHQLGRDFSATLFFYFLFFLIKRSRTSGELQACALINWDMSSAPTSLLAAESAEEVQRLLNAAFPKVLSVLALPLQKYKYCRFYWYKSMNTDAFIGT